MPHLPTGPASLGPAPRLAVHPGWARIPSPAWAGTPPPAGPGLRPPAGPLLPAPGWAASLQRLDGPASHPARPAHPGTAAPQRPYSTSALPWAIGPTPAGLTPDLPGRDGRLPGRITPSSIAPGRYCLARLDPQHPWPALHRSGDSARTPRPWPACRAASQCLALLLRLDQSWRDRSGRPLHPQYHIPVLGRPWLRPVYVAVSLILRRRITLMTRRSMDSS
jgi:hypothetical protein